MEGEYEYIFEMDADFSHNPDDLEKLYNACHTGQGDVAIGSRYITGVNVVNWPLSRVLMSYFASVYVRMITGMKIHDATAGFMCYKRKVFETIPLDKMKFTGYAFQIEMKYRAFEKNFKIIEVPIIFTDRTKGESKMSNAIIKEAVFGVISLRIRKFLIDYKKDKMNRVLIKNAKIVNEGTIFEGDVLIENEFIVEIAESISAKSSECKIIDAEGNYLIPGAIDDQVHFREPGLTHKGDIASESRAAVAGGITSFIEQPNTVPNAVTQEILEEKYQIAAEKSYANYSFMMGATNDNLEEVLKTNPKNVAGIKIFLRFFDRKYAG